MIPLITHQETNWEAQRGLVMGNASAVPEARFHLRDEREQEAWARFRYSCLKEAARGCGGRGPYGYSIMERSGVDVRRDCAGGRNTRYCASRIWLPRTNTSKSVVEESRKRDLFSGQAQRYGVRRSMRSFRVGKSCFMLQR